MKGQSVIEVVIILAMLIGVIGVVFVSPAVRLSSTREGKHTGYVTAVEQSGWFFPNYNVYVKTDNSSSQEDMYCVHRNNRTLGERLKELSKKRQLITITFDGVRGLGYGLCHGEEIKAVTLDR